MKQTPEATTLEFSVDLTNCDREPIHIPGTIQPFGFLLCMDLSTLVVKVASENCLEHTGFTAQQLVGYSIDQLMSDEQLIKLKEVLPTLGTTFKVPDIKLDKTEKEHARLILHRDDTLLWMEVETFSSPEDTTVDISELNETLSALYQADSIKEFCSVMVDRVKAISGFDRVLLYHFKEDGAGEVIAEAKDETVDSFLGLHYPATDIPKQARQMYKKSQLRFIPNINYEPAKIFPEQHPETGEPLDMTYSLLRSVSPIHLQYLRNMEVGASMSISLMKGDELWGLVTCTHTNPHMTNFQRRELCQLMGRTFSAMLHDKEKKEDLGYQLQVHKTQAKLVELLTGREDFHDALAQAIPAIKDVFRCSGAAVILGDEIITVGEAPSHEEIWGIAHWLRQDVQQNVYNTYQLSAPYPPAEAFKEKCSGLLAIAISKAFSDYVLWFRPEVIQTVTWAGNPHKPAQIDEHGEQYLSPRQSFEAWKELVKASSLPWKSFEIQAAREIRVLFTDIILEVASELRTRTNNLLQLNRELLDSNNELDAFAYVASHDLKEPLRGIHNYATFLLEDYAGQLNNEGEQMLNKLMELSERLKSLIDSMFHYSRLGRLKFSFSETDLQALAKDSIELLRPQMEAANAQVTIVDPLPTLRCDRVRMPLVFNNLITNAIRYNNQPKKTVEIGIHHSPHSSAYQPNEHFAAEDYVFFVRDNGIGIDQKFFDTIFVMFKRLHNRKQYSDGSGAGLPIVKRIVEKHGGEIWLESAPEQGTTFFFTLPGV